MVVTETGVETEQEEAEQTKEEPVEVAVQVATGQGEEDDQPLIQYLCFS